ncbi:MULTISPECIES: PD-(D/E)XK motif protein [unclassified Rathayibacter]|uniref:PD-(D/E)XK motif protein n=1 Tax=unclassified Rathayibacter TaxID=2609250 RepID=UPI0015E419D0|nr:MULTISPECIES: PD-(D/E)XK motif protein [unclassified Rathayibacter]
MRLHEAFAAVLQGPDGQVVRVPHLWLRIFAQNGQQHPALVLELPSTPAYFIDGGRGFTAQITQSAHSATSYLRIASSDAEVQPAFLALCQYLLDESGRADGASASVDIFARSLESFRDLLARPRGRLGEDALRGLMAELSILESLADEAVSLSSALRTWSGPYGNSKDFIFPSGHCVEVKSARLPSMEVTISSLQQLEPANTTLQLAVLPMERSDADDGEARNLLQLFDALAEAADADPVSRKLWRDAVETLGFDRDDAYYADWWFRLGEMLAFDVLEGFPRIRAHSVPAAVRSVSYRLDITSLSDFTASLRLH